ncbi:GNAT family N-acetyltransferase [Sphingosinicella sp. CPCC 101087]|uniref:GNAT family N-acetyltransferase n=1 Tax=Sphingosinicella sp. CPCC 101087 TaxID=2497754 RepID=UPI00101D4698|nr:GNAT family N-acetyltransferase [Sphingosinicella sp. CPCC 101087]
MLHPGPLVADGIAAALEPGASIALDHAAAADVPARAFLRAAWFAAAAGDAPLATLVARCRGTEEILAAIPLTRRRIGPLSIPEVGGSYWPWRGFPAAGEGGEAALAALLSSSDGRRALGLAWRIGPVLADDPALARLTAAASRSGWTILSRRLGACFVVDLAALRESGPWPSVKTLRKNRWLERRLGESGELAFESITGPQWNAGTFDRLAHIEGESWVGRRAAKRDTKFLNPDNRAMWVRLTEDPEIAAMLGCSILSVGGEPAAFTFSLRAGSTLHIIANSYNERFREGSPGRILLYRDLQRAAEAGIAAVDWGAGDPGYKSEMGARPGPDMLDLLIVRGAALAALLRPLWTRVRA